MSSEVLSVAQVDRRVEDLRVYNFTVATLHTYSIFVGDKSVVVHNCARMSGHVKKRMKQGGISEDMVYQAIATGKRVNGKSKGTWRYLGRRVWVITNKKTGNVVSAGWR